MRRLHLLPFAGALLLAVSCQKEEVTTEIKEEKRIENVNPDFSQTNITYDTYVRIYGDRGCLITGPVTDYAWETRYHLASGEKKGEKVFYPIKKSWNVTSRTVYLEEGYEVEELHGWEDQSDWGLTDQYYRYDPESKKSFVYYGMDDAEPMEIMNFNLEIGKTYLFDREGEMVVTVEDKFTFESNGETYPALVVRYDKLYETSKNIITSERVVLTPMNPNPLMLGNRIRDINYPIWEHIRISENDPRPSRWFNFSYIDGKPSFSNPENEWMIYSKWETAQLFEETPANTSEKITYHYDLW